MLALSMNEPLHEQQVDFILPLLSPMASHIGNGMTADRQWLKASASQFSISIEDPAFAELELWASILHQTRTRTRSEAAAIQLLQDRGVPEAPAVLAVNAAIGPALIMGATPDVQTALTEKDHRKAAQIRSQVIRLRNALKPSLSGGVLLEPTEHYHEWLPDHNWHSDLDWEHLPSLIKGSPELTEMLRRGGEVNTKHMSYKIRNGRLMRKLHDALPALGLENARERYHGWLPDHEWHDDLDWTRLPVWLKRDRQALDDLFIHRKQVDGKYVSYRVVGNRLLRKLHDSFPAIALESPREAYHAWLPDHNWHDDVDWAHLPPWIKHNQESLNDLLIRRRQVDGKYVSYKVVGNRLMRKLHDSVPVIVLKPPRERYHQRLPGHKWHDDLVWDQLPLWIRGDERSKNDLAIRGEQIHGKYVSYKVVGGRLMRRLRRRVSGTARGRRSR